MKSLCWSQRLVLSARTASTVLPHKSPQQRLLRSSTIAAYYSPVCFTPMAKIFFESTTHARWFSNTTTTKAKKDTPPSSSSHDLSSSRLDPYDERMLNELIAYKNRHGDCHVPAGTGKFNSQERARLDVSEDLATWVSAQRAKYRKTTNSKAAKFDENFQIKVLLLEDMGFLWYERDAQWQRSFNRLEAYGKQNGDLIVARTKDPQLWYWINQQRKFYTRGKLSEQRVSLLEEIGFVFDTSEARWWEFYEELCDYKEKHGDTLVPSNTVEGHRNLGNWVNRQRQRRQSLSKERIQALEKIGFCWNANRGAWNNFYNQLKEFHAEHGHTFVPRSHGPLYNWVSRQRLQLRGKPETSEKAVNGTGLKSVEDEKDDLYKISALNEMEFDWDEFEGVDGDDAERAQRLKKLSFNFAVFDDQWMETFHHLATFKDTFGHFVVPSENVVLFNWVRHQRFLHKRNKLSEDRVAALEGIGFPWTGHEARWDRMYRKLIRFHAKYGHTRVSFKHDKELHRWTIQQRSLFSSDETSKEVYSSPESAKRILALQKVPFEY